MISELPTDWNSKTLKECATWYSGGTPSTTVAEYWNGDIPWITASSLHDFYIRDSERKVTPLGIENGTRLMPKDTIIFVVRGMSLKSEFRVGIAQHPMAFGQDCKAIIAKHDVDPLFLANALRAKSHEILGIVDEASHGTGRLQTSALERLAIPLPPLPEQRAIAHILGTLDDKIELNRQMNQTLEEMARALFQSWFVDFDPVHAKARGEQPAGLDPAIANLFPDRFVETEMGLVPAGWRVGELQDLIYLQRGFDLPTRERVTGKYSILAASGPSGTHNECKAFGPGVVTGRSGVIGKVFYVHEDYWPLNTSLWVKEFRIASPLFAFHLLQTIDLTMLNAGSAVPTLNRNHVHNLPRIVPEQIVIHAFEEMVQPLFAQMYQNEKENETLAELRDTLLPKLMSGELRVPEAVEMVAV